MPKCPKLAFCWPSLSVPNKIKLLWRKQSSPELSQKPQTGRSHRQYSRYRASTAAHVPRVCCCNSFLTLWPVSFPSSGSVVCYFISSKPRLKSWPVHHGHGCPSRPPCFSSCEAFSYLLTPATILHGRGLFHRSTSVHPSTPTLPNFLFCWNMYGIYNTLVEKFYIGF